MNNFGAWLLMFFILVVLMASVREIDPLLKDLNEKNHSFRRNVVLVATELKEVRSKLATQEQSFVRETLRRQEAETRAKNMEEEIHRLRSNLDERNEQLQTTASNAEKCLKHLDDLRLQLAATQDTADARAASAQSSMFQCQVLLKELDEKNSSLKEHEIHVSKLEEHINLLQKDLITRESSQKELKDEVLRMEQDIVQALTKARADGDCVVKKILDEAAPRNFDKINKLLSVKDQEISKLRSEIHIISTHWELKSKDLKSQLEKQRRADQELKKRVLKLEFCLQEARAQTRRLQKMGERRDRTLKELKDQLATTKQEAEASGGDKQNFWESPGFKIVVTMSMLILVLFSKR